MKTIKHYQNFCSVAVMFLVMLLPLFTSCYDDSALNEKLEAVQNEVSQIKTDLTQLKSDLAALKTAVESNLAIAQLNQLPDGYELVFSDGTKAVIKNGTSSVVGAKADEDGIYYWTLNGEWLLDADGNKIKASAEDGEAGHSPEVALKLDEDGYYYWTVDGEWLLDQDGKKVRANGIDGNEPTVKMEYSQSYDMWVWIVNNNRVVDAAGNPVPAQGPAGLDGDAFFESVELSEDGTKLIITLLPETEGGEKVVYEIPMGVFNISFPEGTSASGVTTEVKRFNYTISGVSADDEVIVRVLSTNATEYKIVPDAEKANAGYLEVALTDGEGYVDVYALNNRTGEIKAKSLTIKGTAFVIDETPDMYFSPAGDKAEFALTTGVDYEVVVSDGGWLNVVSEPVTKAVSYYNLVVSAEENSSGENRKATVTITKKDDADRVFAEFIVSQKNYNPAFICDEDDEPIKWEETFGVYDTESNAGFETDPKAEFTNVFTIALSDDFSKGAYKISNMFKVDAYYGEGFQVISGKGGVYYADYEDNTLTVKMANAVKSYFFTSDVALTYDADANTFSSTSALHFTANSVSSWNKEGYIGGYSAAVKEPAGGEDSADPLEGIWNVTCGEKGTSTGGNYVSIIGQTIVISRSNGNYVIEKIAGEQCNMNMTLSGNVLSSVPKYNGASVLTLNYDSEKQTLSQETDFCDYFSPSLKDIIATKGGAVVGIEMGTYSGTGKHGYGSYLSSSFADTFTITENNDDKGEYLITGMFNLYGAGGGVYYANYSEGELTILAAGSVNHEYVGGGLSSDIVMTYSNGTLSRKDVATVGSCSVGEYEAKKN